MYVYWLVLMRWDLSNNLNCWIEIIYQTQRNGILFFSSVKCNSFRWIYKTFYNTEFKKNLENYELFTAVLCCIKFFTLFLPIFVYYYFFFWRRGIENQSSRLTFINPVFYGTRLLGCNVIEYYFHVFTQAYVSRIYFSSLL